MNARILWARRVVLTTYMALLAVFSVEISGIVRLLPETRLFVWVIFVGPLLLFLPGLLRGTWKTYLWLCFALMVYFSLTVSELFGPHREPGDVAELALLVALFLSAMMYARWRRHDLAGSGA